MFSVKYVKKEVKYGKQDKTFINRRIEKAVKLNVTSFVVSFVVNLVVRKLK